MSKSVIPDGLLQREMSRRDFLKVLALGLLTVVGAHNFLEAFKMMSKTAEVRPSEASPKTTTGFGKSKFGV